MIQLTLDGMPEPVVEAWRVEFLHAVQVVARQMQFFTVDDVVTWLEKTLRPVPPSRHVGSAMRSAAAMHARPTSSWTTSTRHPNRPARVWESLPSSQREAP